MRPFSRPKYFDRGENFPPKLFALRKSERIFPALGAKKRSAGRLWGLFLSDRGGSVGARQHNVQVCPQLARTETSPFAQKPDSKRFQPAPKQQGNERFSGRSAAFFFPQGYEARRRTRRARSPVALPSAGLAPGCAPLSPRGAAQLPSRVRPARAAARHRPGGGRHWTPPKRSAPSYRPRKN